MAGTSASGGRNRKSSAEHLLQGTYRKPRHEGVGTPEPPAGHPVPPCELSADERKAWDAMVDYLAQCGTLSPVDAHALYEYVQMWAETRAISRDQDRRREMLDELDKAIKVEPPISDEAKGAAFKAIALIEDLVDGGSVKLRQNHLGLRQYLVEFGMTPAARTRVKLPGEKKPKSLVEEFESRHKPS